MADMGDTTQARWYHPTPDRLVLLLLVVEGLLVAAQWQEWLAKGWPVLIVVATVGGTMLLMVVWFLVAVIFRLRFQFTVRSLLLQALVVAILCSWMKVEMERARKQEAAVEAIGKLGWQVMCDYQLDASSYVKLDASGNLMPPASPPDPTWLRPLLGDSSFSKNFFASAVRVDIGHHELRTAGGELECLKALPDLRVRCTCGAPRSRMLDLDTFKDCRDSLDSTSEARQLPTPG
jgi:hypothetical protein